MQKRILGVGWVAASLAIVLVGLSVSLVHAQNFTNQRAVGGIAVDPSGILDNAQLDATGELSRARTEALGAIAEDLGAPCRIRKVSLRGLAEAIETAKANGEQLPDEVKYLAGLLRIEYVFVYPEQQDIVIVGPAEGWKIDAKGNVVGQQTGRPVMLLDDLLVALRSAMTARAGGISCSIDPTPEGVRRMQTIRGVTDPQQYAMALKNALGPQKITISGVPESSHFARVLVAADYRMKRIAMGFEPSQVEGLPSYIDMVSTATRGMSMPRWWLEPNYAPVVHSPDKLAWNLRGASVKAMTEQDFAGANGQVQHTGRANPIAQRWADLMTEKYSQLSATTPIFGELQNCIDLAVVAALIVGEDLTTRAGGCDLSALTGDDTIAVEKYHAPTSVSTQTTLAHKRGGWVITASGGVMCNSWAIAWNRQESEDLSAVRPKAAPTAETKTWWWN